VPTVPFGERSVPLVFVGVLLIEGRLSYYDDWLKLDPQFQKAIAAKAAGLIASDDPQSVFVLLAGLGIDPYSG
jgi:hypothetical protein